MSTSRVIKFKIFSQEGVDMIKTDARTFADLKEVIKNDPELSEKINLEQCTFTVKETMNTIFLDSAILPATDFIMFVSPSKTDNGATGAEAPELLSDEEIDDMGYNEVRKYLKSLKDYYGVSVTIEGTASELRELAKDAVERIEEEEEEEETPYEDEESVENLLEQASDIINKLKELIIVEAGAEKEEDNSNVVVRVTVEELEEELENITDMYKNK